MACAQRGTEPTAGTVGAVIRSRVATDAGRPLLAPVAVATLAGALLALLGVYRHNRFGSSAFDLGIFDQTVWHYSRFEVGPNTVKGMPNLLGDHFHPVLGLLAPLYWVWSDARILLVAQAVLLAVSSLPLHAFARDTVGGRAALALQSAYLLSWPVVAGALFDFHELAFAPLFVAIALWALLSRNIVVYSMSIVLLLLVKEDMALIAIGIGVVAFTRGSRHLGIATITIAAVWAIFVVEVVIPAIAGRDYTYAATIGGNDGSPLAAISWVITHPAASLSRLVDEPEKLTLLLLLGGTFAGVSLFSPIALAIVPALVPRLLSDNPAHWATGFHYSLPIAPVLAFAAADGLRRLRPRLSPKAFTVTGTLAVAASVALGASSVPLREIRRVVDRKTSAAVARCLAQIPPEASVVATQALVPHLSERRAIYTFYSVRTASARPAYAAFEFNLAPHSPPMTRIRPNVSRWRAAGYVTVCRNAKVLVLKR